MGSTTVVSILAASPAAWAQEGAAANRASSGEANTASPPISQPAPPTPASSDVATGARPGTTQLQEVVVTAQRREQNLQRVAASITALSGEGLRKTGRTDLDTALEQVPGVVVQGGPAGYEVSIRGVGQDQPPSATDSSVTVSRDGVIDTNTLGAKVGFYDINRIEVLRGPQGTLYGRNAIAGAVNINTNDPTHRYEASALLELGDYDLVHAEAVVNAPVNDQLAFRLAAAHISHDGYMSNGALDADDQSVRLKALWTPTNQLTALLAAEYSIEGGAGAGDTALSPDGSLGKNPYESRSASFVPPPPFKFTYADYPDNQINHATAQRYYAKVDYNLGFGVFTVIPALQENTAHSNYYFTGLKLNTSGLGDQESLEARLNSEPNSSIKWVGGLYFYRTRQLSSNFTYAYTIAGATETNMLAQIDDMDNRATSAAAFAEATVPVTSRFRLTGGVRESYDDKVFDDTSTNPNIVSPQDVGIHSSSFTYKVGAEYDLARRSLVYAQVASGYRAGGYNNQSLRIADGIETGSPYYKPERLVAYEAGSKNRFFDNRLQFNADVFYYNYMSYQASTASATLPPFNITTNAKAHLYGAELETTYAVTRLDQVTIAAAYLHSAFDSFADASDGVYDGRPLSHSPKWTVSPMYEHNFPLWTGGRVTFHADTKYITHYLLDFNSTAPAGVEPSHFNSNANLNIVPYAGSRYSMSVYVKNLEDHAVKDFIVPAPPGYVVLEAPRTYGVVLNAKFM